MKKIRVEIDKSGEVVVGVTGACGTECADLTRGLESALGAVTEQTKTPEYYAASAEQKSEVNNWK